MSNISASTIKLIEKYQFWYYSLQAKENQSTINVDNVTSKVAKFYEKIREIVDWREKHLMRRIAIERVLKRRFFLKSSQAHIAEDFVVELIRNGHFPNNKIPKNKIVEIQKIIDKYNYIIDNAPRSHQSITHGQLYIFLISIAACEVEETLDPLFYLKEHFLVEYMETSMQEKIKIGQKVLNSQIINQHEKEIQIYIAVQQALLKLDSPIISYYLLKRYYKNWLNPSQQELTATAQNIYKTWQRIEQSIEHPLAGKFYKICEQYDTPYLLLGDILSADPIKNGRKLIEPDFLKEMVKKVYKKRLSTLKSRISRTAFYSTLSIFISNIFSLYILEFPFAKYVMGEINVWAALFDVLGPTFLMFLLMVTIRMPNKKNYQLVLAEVEKIVYENQAEDFYEVELYPKKSFIFKFFTYLIYIISFCLCFGLIIWVLMQFNYPPLSYALLIMFTSLIAFSGLKLRQRSKELSVMDQREGLFNIIFDPFSLPMVQLGKWLSARWKKINIVGVIFIFLIDTPFLIFIDFLEQWRYFVKEKKENIR